MTSFRSDLTLESAEQLGIAGKNARRQNGVRVVESMLEGYGVTAITIGSAEGSLALGKPVGRYVTVDLQPYFQRQSHFFPRGVRCLGRELRQLLPNYPDLRELVHILEELPDLSTELVPGDSLLREFIGGSELHY